MLNWLLTCRATDPDQVRRGRLLNWFLLSFTAIALLNLMSTLILGIPVLALVIGALTGLLLVLYALNRRGDVTLVAVSLVGLMFILIHLLAVLPTGGAVSAGLAPALFGVPIALAGVTLAWQAVPLVVGLAMVDSLWLYAVGIPQLAGYRTTNADDMRLVMLSTLTLLLALGLLAALSSRQIQTILADVRHHNMELAAANRDLARQSRREHELGAGMGDLAAQLAAVSRRQGQGVATQAAAISQVVNAVARLHAAAQQISAIAAEVGDAGETALLSVQQAQEMVQRSREAVQRNRAQVEQVMARMQTLDQLTARITEFMNRSRDLSDETQLLALNATIEAAGAGALGRRFGVVAGEVQNLALRSNEIVDQVRVLIGALQQAGQQTQAATSGGMAVADEVEHLTDQVRQAQAQVVVAVQRTSALAHLIATATDQQTTAALQMTRTMEQITQGSQLTSQDTAALERVVGEMTRAAGQLNTTPVK